MTDPVDELLEQARQAGVTLDPPQLEWLDRMRREHGEEVQFELWKLPKEGQ
ncbi:hypothetical protein ACQEUU_37250 [Nonomuraea sp. CA-218870]|uniref:hypothetical protein n=1 Tax=Nonomuraea sp. CA-218870 TaxID=3239998 RepID=UPI003D901E24